MQPPLPIDSTESHRQIDGCGPNGSLATITCRTVLCILQATVLISAHVAQVEMSRGTLTSLNQTGECFLLTFDLGRQDVNNKNSHGITELGRSATDQPRNGSTTAPGPKSCRQQVGMCCCALLLDFDTVDMLTKINKHVFCKAPSSSVCPSCLRQDNQSRGQSLFDVRVACLHVVLFFSCCRVRV